MEHLIPLHRRIMDEEDFNKDITIQYRHMHPNCLAGLVISVSVLIVGSIAYDSVESPAGWLTEPWRVGDYAGCRAVSFSRCTVRPPRFGGRGRFCPNRPGCWLQWVEGRLGGGRGETFRWEGAYHGAMAEAETRATHLNVLEHLSRTFQPRSSTWRSVLCQPASSIQRNVIGQTSPVLTILDLMNLWSPLLNRPSWT